MRIFNFKKSKKESEVVKTIPKEENDFISELEKLIREKIPISSIVQYDNFGMVIENNHVVQLNIRKNEIKRLPESIENLAELKILYIGDCGLTDIPKTLENLQNLIILDISQNKLEVIPEWIGNLTSLEELYLHFNKFNTLPREITRLKNLKHLTLLKSSDPLTSLNLPDEVVSWLYDLRYSKGCSIKGMPEGVD